MARKKKRKISRAEQRKRQKHQQQFSIRCIPCDRDVLFQRGPAIDVLWVVPPDLAKRLQAQGMQVPLPISGPVLVDTGAIFSCIAEETAQHLGLRPIDTQMTSGVHGPRESNRYHVGLQIPVGRTRTIATVTRMIGVPDLETESKKYGRMVNQRTGRPVGFTGLLGRDFLRHATLTYDGMNGRLSLMTHPSLFRS